MAVFAFVLLFHGVMDSPCDFLCSCTFPFGHFALAVPTYMGQSQHEYEEEDNQSS